MVGPSGAEGLRATGCWDQEWMSRSLGILESPSMWGGWGRRCHSHWWLTHSLEPGTSSSQENRLRLCGGSSQLPGHLRKPSGRRRHSERQHPSPTDPLLLVQRLRPPAESLPTCPEGPSWERCGHLAALDIHVPLSCAGVLMNGAAKVLETVPVRVLSDQGGALGEPVQSVC